MCEVRCEVDCSVNSCELEANMSSRQEKCSMRFLLSNAELFIGLSENVEDS